MLTSTQCRALAKEYKDLARRAGVSEDSAFIMTNIARSLNGLATQLDMLAAKTRDENRYTTESCGSAGAQHAIHRDR
jgi:hypothetical protein